MKGCKGIALLGAVCLISIYILRIRDRAERTQPGDAPVAIQGVSEDAKLSFNWGLDQIHALSAWKRQRGSKDVVVAVIDTGCDIHHPELSQNVWRNPGESGRDARGNSKEDNGIDDDANGFVDDLHGWSFVSDSNDIEDEHGHGTHIAGIIGAERSQGLGSSGVAPHVSLMILKYYDPEGDGISNLQHTVAAIHYAVRMGADIINYSGGGLLKSKEEEAALHWAAKKGVLIVAAAGNEGRDSDLVHFYPADYELPNIISVAAVDQTENLLSSSNYGIQTVHIAAPGKNIFSTLPNGQHGFMTGTSQATAFVTGVAALMIANEPRLKWQPKILIENLLQRSQHRIHLHGKIRSEGILDAFAALGIVKAIDLSKVESKDPPRSEL